MQITINLTDAETKGIADYLKAETGERTNKTAIGIYIMNIVSGNLYNPKESVSDYIKKYEMPSN